MKTLIACAVFLAIGAYVGFQINEERYGKYEAYLGPLDEARTVSAARAIEMTRENIPDKRASVETPKGREHDFGAMSPDEEGEHIFIIRNVGEEDLELKVGASTCKCTVGSLETNMVPPGEETEIKLAWSIKTNENKFGQSAEIITNDPENVAVRFEIKGQVVRQLEMVPDAIAFGEVAAGEPVDVEVRVFNYMDSKITPGEARFTSDELNELSNFEVTPFEPSGDDGIHESATQGFLIKATIQPGLKQGPVSQNLIFPFTMGDDSGSGEAKIELSQSLASSVPVTGRIVGALSMLESSKLQGVSGGGYIYDFGKIEPGKTASANAFLVLRGAAREGTTMTIGETSPPGLVEATLGKPVGRSTTTLYNVTIKLIPGDETVERLGLNREDYGFVMIESDNPKVPAMKLRLKFSLPAR